MDSHKPICGVLLPWLAGKDTAYELCRTAVDRARSASAGPFGRADILTLDCRRQPSDLAAALNSVVKAAASRGIEWLLQLNADDILVPSAFSRVEELTGSFDVIVGRSTQCSEAPNDSLPQSEWLKRGRPADPLMVPHSGYFVRTEVALNTPCQRHFEQGGDFDALLRRLQSGRALRIDQPLAFRTWEASLNDPSSPERRRQVNRVMNVVRGLDEGWHVDCRFRSHGAEFYFRVRDPLDMIQKYHFGGLLWEGDELALIASRVGKGSVIVDVGSHVGNHAVFYGKKILPSRIVLIEPNSSAISHLKENLELNAVDVADDSLLGVGVGRDHGQARVMDRVNHNSGAASLEFDEDGDIPVAPLCDLISHLNSVDFIKIDVESMELDVLAGAEPVLAQHRPEMLIEIKTANIELFLTRLADLNYRVIQRFENPIETNFYVAPETG